MRQIYCITNVINGKRYVGQTKNLKRRMKQHFTEAPRQCDHPMARAVRKYGRESFTIIVIEECDDSSVDQRERFWIVEYKTNDSNFGYNCDEGGNACKTLSAETRRKISESRKRWYASLNDEGIRNFRAAHQNHPPKTEEVKRAMSLRTKGIKKSSEHKNKIAKAHAARVGKHETSCKCAMCCHWTGKLTLEERYKIKQRCDGTKISREFLAEEFRVSTSTIHRIFLGPQIVLN